MCQTGCCTLSVYLTELIKGAEKVGWLDNSRESGCYVYRAWLLTCCQDIVEINPFTADPVKALHFAVLV